MGRGGAFPAGTATLALAAALLLALSVAAGAQAAIPFCLPGTGPEQCEDPIGLAVNEATGTVYVADTGNNRVQIFEADGNHVGLLGEEGPGSGPGEFEGPTQVAVDQASGDVYVVDYGNARVQRFNEAGEFLLTFGGEVNTGTSGEPDICTNAGPPTDVCGPGTSGGEEGEISTIRAVGIGAGPAGVAYVVDNLFTNGANESGGFETRLQRFEPNGEPIPPQCFLLDPESKERARSVAVTSTGPFWVGSEVADRAVRRFSTSCGFEEVAEETETGGPFAAFTALAVDGEDNLFSVQGEVGPVSGTYRTIAEYDEEGNTVQRFGYDLIENGSEGIAFHEDNLYVADEEEGVKLLEVPEGEPQVPPSSVKASPRSVWAAIETEINPEGKATDYLVEWTEKTVFEEEGFAGAQETDPIALESEGFSLAAGEAVIGCNPFSEEALEEGECLKPETKYVARVVATNSDGTGEAQIEFETAPPIDILATYANAVGPDSATVGAQLNPLGSAAQGYFEYVTQSAFEASGFTTAKRTPPEGSAQIDFGAGEEPATGTANLLDLEEGTTYRYRLVATNPFATLEGPTRALRTFAKATGEPCPNAELRSGPGALLPDCRAYEQVSPDQKGGSDIKVLGAASTGLPAVLEQSAGSGSKLAYGSQQAFGGSESAPYTSQYIAQRQSEGWSTHPINPPRSKQIFESISLWDTEYKLFSEDLCEGWIRPFGEPPLGAGAEAGFANLYRRTDELCGGDPDYETLVPGLDPPEGQGSVELQGVSADRTKTVVRANGALAEGGSGGMSQVYGYSKATGLRFLCVLPGGEEAAGHCSAGSSFDNGFTARKSNPGGALSEDGDRLYFTAAAGPGRIYLREDPFGEAETLEVSKGAEEETGTTASRYQGAAADGSVAVFRTGGVNGALHEYSREAEASTEIAKEAQGILGMSDDGSRIYFVSREDLDGEAVAGEPNLYLREGGEARFVATLGEEDVEAAVTFQPGYHASRVSADGSHAAFMSADPALAEAVAGADITDRASPEACTPEAGEAALCDAQVYLYDAEAQGGAGELVCVSCNPSGARPLGAKPKFIGFERAAAKLPTFQSAFYAARVLSADGSRLYFESSDRLVARDTNGRGDVYQWEAEGKGGCDASDYSFQGSSGGCVELISNGQSLVDSRLVDASPSGDDVFFATLSSLRGTDSGLVDIYDARVGGGYPEPPAPASGCEGQACQSAPPAPESQTPASATYTGPGDLATPSRAPARCARPARRAKRLSRRAKALRRSARASRAPAAKRRRARSARRSARKARKLSRNAKRCRARARTSSTPRAKERQ